MNPLLCLLLGYLCGCFLPAELVARLRTGKSASEIGSGNPGVANIGGQLGFKWGALVLLGDVSKTVVACALAGVLFPTPLSTLYAGLGAALGHNFPIFRGFRGGKGVTVTCTFLILFSPVWGTLCSLCGLAVALVTGWLSLGALLIPAAFIPFAFLFHGAQAGLLAIAATLLMFSRHAQGLRRILRGEERRAFRGKNTRNIK